MGSSYAGRGSAVTGIFVKNWIKADGFLKPQTSVIRFSPLYTDWRMIALDDTGAEKYREKQARFEQCVRIVILCVACSWTPLPGHCPQWSRGVAQSDLCDVHMLLLIPSTAVLSLPAMATPFGLFRFTALFQDEISQLWLCWSSDFPLMPQCDCLF